MAQILDEERQLTFKLVYCGPPLAGKTTNLSKLHELVDSENRGRLMTLDGSNDRTLFFDLLPIFFRVSGLSVRIKVYTVPGQPAHQMTRRAVLRGVDGVVFVADSSPGQGAKNRLSYDELRANLNLVGVRSDKVALVTQFNKQDVEGAASPEAFDSEIVESATASQGDGVLETFLRIAAEVWTTVNADVAIEEQFSVSKAQFCDELALHLRRA